MIKVKHLYKFRFKIVNDIGHVAYDSIKINKAIPMKALNDIMSECIKASDTHKETRTHLHT